jgi:hypothetical protein
MWTFWLVGFGRLVKTFSNTFAVGAFQWPSVCGQDERTSPDRLVLFVLIQVSTDCWWNLAGLQLPFGGRMIYTEPLLIARPGLGWVLLALLDHCWDKTVRVAG